MNGPLATATGTTENLRTSADEASHHLDTAANVWTTLVEDIARGPLLRVLIERHGVDSDEAQARVRSMTRSMTRAADSLRRAAHDLHTITVDIEVMHEDAGTTGLPTGA